MERAIGIIDSGVGGLTVAYELMRQLPKENLIYLGDTLRCPYGPRSKEEVRKFTLQLVDFLVIKNIKMLVVACNTATAFTLNELQESLNIPVIGVIQPGARAAIKTSENNCIGIIGTEGTINSGAYKKELSNINSNICVRELACPLFVPMVEKGILEGEKAEGIIKESLTPLKKRGQIDTLILGCTHYPLLTSSIQKVMGSSISLVSSSEETARETSASLEFHQLLNPGRQSINLNHQFYTTGDLGIFTKITQSIFNSTIDNLTAATIEKTTI
ncbi:glutamate racemase [Virgibacillus kimchii]